MNSIKNMSDLATGLVFTASGVAFAMLSDWDRFGNATRMGPSFFPIVLGVFLALIGIACLVRAVTTQSEQMTPIIWKAIVVVPLSVVFFGITARGLGFVPAVAGVSIISFAASSKFRLSSALIAAAAIVCFTSLVFIYGLKLPLPIFGEWLTN